MLGIDSGAVAANAPHLSIVARDDVALDFPVWLERCFAIDNSGFDIIENFHIAEVQLCGFRVVDAVLVKVVPLQGNVIAHFGVDEDEDIHTREAMVEGEFDAPDCGCDFAVGGHTQVALEQRVVSRCGAFGIIALVGAQVGGGDSFPDLFRHIVSAENVHTVAQPFRLFCGERSCVAILEEVVFGVTLLGNFITRSAAAVTCLYELQAGESHVGGLPFEVVCYVEAVEKRVDEPIYGFGVLCYRSRRLHTYREFIAGDASHVDNIGFILLLPRIWCVFRARSEERNK